MPARGTAREIPASACGITYGITRRRNNMHKIETEIWVPNEEKRDGLNMLGSERLEKFGRNYAPH